MISMTYVPNVEVKIVTSMIQVKFAKIGRLKLQEEHSGMLKVRNKGKRRERQTEKNKSKNTQP